jgi:hypothetical protein
MLAERITNDLVKYKLTGENPKKAFLFIISNYNAGAANKVKLLAEIANAHPGLIKSIFPYEMFTAFLDLLAHATARGEVLSCAELNWVSLYVTDTAFRLQIEEFIYIGLLRASDHHDLGRRGADWKLTNEAKGMIATQIINDPKIGSKRKMQIAREFDLPWDVHARKYFKTLLEDGHLTTAMALEIENSDDLTIDAIVDKLNTGHVDQAIEIAASFLPHREDVKKELEEIRKKLRP